MKTGYVWLAIIVLAGFVLLAHRAQMQTKGELAQVNADISKLQSALAESRMKESGGENANAKVDYAKICRSFSGASIDPATGKCVVESSDDEPQDRELSSLNTRIKSLEDELRKVAVGNRPPPPEEPPPLGRGVLIITKKGFHECYNPTGDAYCFPLAGGQSEVRCRTGMLSVYKKGYSNHGHDAFFSMCSRKK